MAKRLHVFFSGHVQGVGFRQTVVTLARQFAVSGWVRNLYDGRVEMKAEGTEAELEKFLSAILSGMRGYAESHERSWENATGEWTSFTVSSSV